MQLSPLQSALLYFRYFIYPEKKTRSFDLSDLIFIVMAFLVLALGLLMSEEISISYNEAKDFFYSNTMVCSNRSKKHRHFRSKRFGFEVAFFDRSHHQHVFILPHRAKDLKKA